MTEQKTNTRAIILDILMEIMEQGGYSHVVLRGALDKYAYLDKKDRAFITKVTEGTLERVITIDYALNQFSKVKVHKMKPVIRNILRSAVYQLLYLDGVPSCAIVDEAVKLTAKRGFTGLKGFVNGVLRTIDRKRDEIRWPDRKTDSVDYLSVRYSMPEWIIRQWLPVYGEELTERSLASFLTEKGTSARVNLRKASPESIKEELTASGIRVVPSAYLPYAFTISGYDRLSAVPAFARGDLTIQDVSSMLAVELAGIKEGDLCLDLCAAPGGKTSHMLDKGGRVTACDISERKTRLIQESLKGRGIQNAEILVRDAREFRPEWEDKYDVTLADLPCSGLGVLGRKNDLKYKMTPELQDELAALQKEILRNAVRYVKPGGTLIYSTCTINRKENEENAAFLAAMPDTRPVDLTKALPAGIMEAGTSIRNFGEDARNGYIQLLPGVFECDGFFIACFKKTAESGK